MRLKGNSLFFRRCYITEQKLEKLSKSYFWLRGFWSRSRVALFSNVTWKMSLWRHWRYTEKTNIASQFVENIFRGSFNWYRSSRLSRELAEISVVFLQRYYRKKTLLATRVSSPVKGTQKSQCITKKIAKQYSHSGISTAFEILWSKEFSEEAKW